jgi:molecular chaperone GrpE
MPGATPNPGMSDDAAESEREHDAAAESAPENGTAEDTTGEPEGPDLVDAVAEHDQELAERVADLRTERERATERIEEVEAKLKRTAAEFENYKRRQERRREELKERAAADLVERLTDVRDNLVRALDQDEGADIRDGVVSTLERFDEVLDEEGVEPVEPEPGTEVDPHRHEVLMRVESDRPEGEVVDVYRPGYVLADRVLQTAQVTVSEGGDGSDDDGAGDDPARGST